MAKGSRAQDDDPYGRNEVDDFADKREKVLLSESTLARRNGSDEEDLMDEEEEEVMAMSEDEDEDEDEDEEMDGAEAYRKVFGRKLETDMPDEEYEDEEGMLDNENAWGATKNEYYGADDLDDAETAKEIEKEALRQQKKHLAELNMEDYYDDVVEEEWSKDAKEFDMKEFKASTKQSEAEISIKSILNMDDNEKKQHLNNMFPEFIPLSKELKSLTAVHNELRENSDSEVNKLKLIALSSYLSTLSSYFAIFLHELHNNEEFTTMKEHSVMEAILTSKEIWRQANELPVDDVITGSEEMSESEGSDAETLVEKYANSEKDDAEASEGSDEEEEDDDESEVDIDDFEEYVKQSRVSKKKAKSSKTPEKEVDGSEYEDNADFIEGKIADIDAEDKRKRKKSLRFYTSKIDQQELKKAEKFTGDEDIPYKERLFERQQRLLEEARKRGLHAPKSADLDNEDYGSDDQEISKNLNDKSSAEYYKQILQGKRDKKDGRKKAHFDALIAAREGKLNEVSEEVGDDGKRAINYQILKNKGLTPKRKKDNRNSRVKKRKKYEKAQKKLKSVRAVYSGGQTGAYEGEKTGIKKNLTRSVKFKS
ncbi:Something about silencing protein 10 [Nakaseomyces bracarensis]|uniref:Something about silencing protein 10 n=1 Tax=Nakaseomyces bracarensis TaxID=273131 RepID=A0ABR4NVW8_9SACH